MSRRSGIPQFGLPCSVVPKRCVSRLVLVLVGLLTVSAGAVEWTGQLLRLEAEPDSKKSPVVTAVCVHPEGKTIAVSGDDHCIRICEIESGKTVQRLLAHSDWVRSLVFSPAGDSLASAGNDGRIVFWDAATGQIRSEARLGHAVAALSFSPDGKTLAAAGFGERLQILDTTTAQPVRAFNCPCQDMRALASCSDRGILAGGGRNGIIRLWNSDGQVLQEYAAHRRRIWGLAFSPDGRYLVSCSEDGKTRVSRLDGQEDFVLESPGSKVMSLVFCGPDQLATGGSDNLIHIWDLNRQAEISRLSGHTGSVVALAYSGTTLVSAGFDTTVRVWKRNERLAEDPQGPQERVGARTESVRESP